MGWIRGVTEVPMTEVRSGSDDKTGVRSPVRSSLVYFSFLLFHNTLSSLHGQLLLTTVNKLKHCLGTLSYSVSAMDGSSPCNQFNQYFLVSITHFVLITHTGLSVWSLYIGYIRRTVYRKVLKSSSQSRNPVLHYDGGSWPDYSKDPWFNVIFRVVTPRDVEGTSRHRFLGLPSVSTPPSESHKQKKEHKVNNFIT